MTKDEKALMCDQELELTENLEESILRIDVELKDMSKRISYDADPMQMKYWYLAARVDVMSDLLQDCKNIMHMTSEPSKK